MSLIPFTGARGHYRVVTDTPTWLYHARSSGGLTGVRATTLVESDPEKIAPSSIIAGLVKFTDLVDGGLFHEIAKFGKSVLIRAVDLSGAGTISSIQTVNFTNPLEVIRDILPLVQASPFEPFTLAPNEMIKVVCSSSKIGFFISETPKASERLY